MSLLIISMICAALIIGAGVGVLFYRHYRNRTVSELVHYLQANAALADTSYSPPLPIDPTFRSLTQAVDLYSRHQQLRQQQLGEYLNQEQALVESLHEPVLFLNAERLIVRANRAAFRLLGEKILNTDIAQWLSASQIVPAIQQALEGENVPAVPITIEKPVTHHLMVQLHLLPQNEVRTKQAALLLILQDITPLKKAEESRLDFIAQISHELRTPLVSLLGFIETIRGPAKNDSEAVDRFLGIMHEQAGRMANLVTDLLALSKAELQEHEAPTEAINVIKLLGNLLAATELRAQEKEITLFVDAPRELPDVLGDSDQLQRSIQNLIENAMKYGQSPGQIDITARLEGNMVAVSVRDYGEGLTQEQVARLSERFYRTEQAKAKKIPGTGLGLAIVKHIVKRHRGRLMVASELGQGTTFTILLPIAISEA